jgi:hypothetical protein
MLDALEPVLGDDMIGFRMEAGGVIDRSGG